MEPSGHYTLKGTLGFWNRAPIKRYIRGNPPQSQLDSAAATPSRHPSEVGVCRPRGSLGGLWVAVSGDISPLIWVVTVIIRLMTLLTTTDEPPSADV